MSFKVLSPCRPWFAAVVACLNVVFYLQFRFEDWRVTQTIHSYLKSCWSLCFLPPWKHGIVSYIPCSVAQTVRSRFYATPSLSLSKIRFTPLALNRLSSSAISLPAYAPDGCFFSPALGQALSRKTASCLLVLVVVEGVWSVASTGGVHCMGKARPSVSSPEFSSNTFSISIYPYLAIAPR